MDRKIKEREQAAADCENSDKLANQLLKDYLNYKYKYEDITSDLVFIEEQINQAQLNEFKLNIRIEELTAELNSQELSDDEEEKDNETDNQYF